VNHLLHWSDSVGKWFAGLSLFGAAMQEQALAYSAALTAILATLLPHILKSYRDYRSEKRAEDTADLNRQEYELALRERYRLEERAKILADRIKEIEGDDVP